MNEKLEVVARATAFCALVLMAGCGGGGGGASGTTPPPAPPANRAPSLTASTAATDEDTQLIAQLAATDPDGHPITFALAGNAEHGTATITPSGALTYLPTTNYSGSDSIRVTVGDNAGGESTGTVAITVQPVNDAPFATGDVLQVAAANGQPVALDVLSNDGDLDGDTLIPEVVTQPNGGVAVVDAISRQMRFEPANGYVGPIEFTYRVSDGSEQSSVSTVRAYVGDPAQVIFLSDYSTPGVLEVHVFDGFEVRRVSDDIPSGQVLSTFAVSGDQRTLAYVLSDADTERVYVKPLDGSSPAALRFTSAAKTAPAERRVSVSLNSDGSYALIRDGWVDTVKLYYTVDTTSGAARRVAESMPGVVDTRIVLFHPYEPQSLLLQGQTSGSGPNDLANRATSAFIGNAADPRTLTQIGRTYVPGQCGSGEGIYVGNDPRFIYHGEFLCAANVINLIAYDRQSQTEAYVVREAMAPDRGLNGVVAPVFATSRLCFAFYLPNTTTFDGPTNFYAMSASDPASAIAVSPALDRTTQCTMSGDDRTVIYRQTTANGVTQLAYSVDATNPGTPRLLAPPAEVAAEQAAWQVAFESNNIAIAYFDNDGVAGITSGQVGRFYRMSADGTPDHFLFSDSYIQSSVGGISSLASDDGAFLLYARPSGGISALELMSTHALNLSIPLSREGETLGVQSMRWLRRSVRIN
ncbi:MAG TPA: cadherin-like domain-containing protein [Steroidobacteraceae bacterium]